MTKEWLHAMELLYVISNLTISVICILSCIHIIHKLKRIYKMVCCSVALLVSVHSRCVWR